MNNWRIGSKSLRKKNKFWRIRKNEEVENLRQTVRDTEREKVWMVLTRTGVNVSLLRK